MLLVVLVVVVIISIIITGQIGLIIIKVLINIKVLQLMLVKLVRRIEKYNL